MCSSSVSQRSPDHRPHGQGHSERQQLEEAIELVETKVLPHFNFLRMTSLAVGRTGTKLRRNRKTALAKEFETLLVRTYSNALTAYKSQTIVY